MQLTPEQIKSKISYSIMVKLFQKMGYPVFLKGKYNLNVGLIRTNAGVGEVSSENRFNDLEVLFYLDQNNKPACRAFWCTTEPGTTYLIDPMNRRGTAILDEAYNHSAWRLGNHKGKSALVQCAPIHIIRDPDKDKNNDFNGIKTQENMIGLNNHGCRTDRTVQYVNEFSAGCVAVPSWEDMIEIIHLVMLQKEYGFSDVVSFGLANQDRLTGLI